jgi:hypothetical protein
MVPCRKLAEGVHSIDCLCSRPMLVQAERPVFNCTSAVTSTRTGTVTSVIVLAFAQTPLAFLLASTCAVT